MPPPEAIAGGGGGDGPSWSRSVCETANGSHQYTVKGFSLAKGMGSGRYVASDTFAVGGYEWAVYFYPDGKNPEDNAGYVSVFVALASEGTDVRALFELTLVDQSGKGRHKVHSHFDRALDAFFDLEPHYWHGFLSSRMFLRELVLFGLSLFAHASNTSRLEIMAKGTVPLARMVNNLLQDR